MALSDAKKKIIERLFEEATTDDPANIKDWLWLSDSDKEKKIDDYVAKGRASIAKSRAGLDAQETRLNELANDV